MPFDAKKNGATSLVAVAPSPASSGLTLTVTAGEGARFPAPPFNASVWPAGAVPTAANIEIIRVTGVAGDVFTILRAQESTSARAILVGDQVALAATAKTFTDIETAVDANTSALAGKAPIASPAFTGTPTTAATPAPLDNSTKLATTGYTDAAVAVEASRATAAEATKATAAALTTETNRATAAEALLIPLTQKGAANGVPTLNAGSVIPLAQLPAGVFELQGVWNAATNSPTLVNGTGTSGFLYRVSVAGTQNLGAGAVAFSVGDEVFYDGSAWQKIGSGATSGLTSFQGRVTPAAVLTKADVTGTGLAAADIGADAAGAATAAQAASAPIGTVAQNVRNLTAAPASVAAGDVLRCDATAGAFALPLPTPTAGIRIITRKVDASANAVTLTGTVDGVVNPTLTVQWQSIELEGNGSSWDRVVRPVFAAIADYPAATDARYARLGQVILESVNAPATLNAAATLDLQSARQTRATYNLGPTATPGVLQLSSVPASGTLILRVIKASGVGGTLSLTDGTTTWPVDISAAPANGAALIRVDFFSTTDWTASVLGAGASPTIPSPPGQVTSLSTIVGNSQITLNWAVPFTGGTAVTDALVEYRTTAGPGAWTTFAHTPLGSTLSIVVTGLTNGTSYDFRVSAVNAQGTGQASAPATASPSSLSAYALAVTADAPVAWWRLGEASGTSAADAAGANTGTYSGAYTLGAASLLSQDTANTAVTFSGGQMAAPDAAALRLGAGDFTLEAWIKPTAAVAYACIFDTVGRGIGMAQTGSGAGVLRVYAGGTQSEITMPASFVAGSKYHVVATRISGTIRVYLNGVVGASPLSNAGATANTNGVSVGGNPSGSIGTFAGVIDEPAIYNFGLSAARVLAHYNAGV